MNEETATEKKLPKSEFDGGLFSFFVHHLIAFLLTIFTLGLAFPWAVCIAYGWKINHTKIDGKRLQFNGSGFSLFGNWIKWMFFTIITLGIYSLWLFIALEKWKVKNTTFARTPEK